MTPLRSAPPYQPGYGVTVSITMSYEVDTEGDTAIGLGARLRGGSARSPRCPISVCGTLRDVGTRKADEQSPASSARVVAKGRKRTHAA